MSKLRMADPLDPLPSPSPAPPPAPEPLPPNPNPLPDNPPPHVENTDVSTNSTGLPSNVAAALACFPLIGGIIFYLLEKRDSFVRFYAMQSIIFGAVWILFSFLSNILTWILASIPGVGGFFAMSWNFIAALVHLGFFIIMVIAMVKAFSGARWDIPYVGPHARKQTGA
jgi:uncharacterized membrane protein